MKEKIKQFILNRKKNIIQYKGKVMTSANSIINICDSALIELHSNYYMGADQYRGSKEETYLKLGNRAKLIVYGEFKQIHGSTIQLFDDAMMEVGHSYINHGTVIMCKKKISIGNGVMIGRNVKIYDADYHMIIENEKVVNKEKEITIQDHVWIGANAIILKGVTLGEGSIVAAGAIVTKDVPEKSVVAGIPACVIRENVLWH